jgi:hypothetical protein
LPPHNVSNPEHARAKRYPFRPECQIAADDKKYSDNANADRQHSHVIKFHDQLPRDLLPIRQQAFPDARAIAPAYEPSLG